ncbi:exodeoxyribonuclease VII small subunit [Candidatus Saccharibacteria bacterium]|nr:exodeoxyribonuclease VII small subunit [Candidatus Saccharibacteria bacterium]
MQENKTLNQKIKELEDEVEWFYSDDFELGEATEKYKSAILLAKELQKELKDLQNEIEVLKEDFSK